MKLQHILFGLFIFLSLKPNLMACSGAGEIAFCNIIHNSDFVENGLVWIGEPLDSCQTYHSFSGIFTDSYTSPQAPLHIDTNLLPVGLYFVKVQHQVLNDVYVKRILKE